MVNKKTKLVELTFSVLILSLLFVSFVSAENARCEVTTPANCNTLNGDAIMRLSDTTNAHGANLSETLYSQVLCCVNFEEGLGTICTGNNTLLRLSSSTNAHAETPAYSNYSTNICYEGFVPLSSPNACYHTQLTESCGSDEIETLYLSSLGNSHLGSTAFSSGAKICCRVKPMQNDCSLSSASWGDSICTYPETKVPMTVTGGEYCNQETNIKYEIYEGSTLKDTIEGKYDKDFWTAISATDNKNKNYYFNASALTLTGIVASTVKSNTLTVYDKKDVCTSLAISTCADYEKILEGTCSDAAKDMCNANTCGVTITAEGAKCSWNDTESKCETTEIVNYCGDNSLEMPPEECDGIRTKDGIAWSFIDFGEYGTSDQEGSCARYNSNFISGELGCYHPNPENPDQCTINTLNCVAEEQGVCGDGEVNATGEKCDLTDLNGKTCVSLGYDEGDLSCTSKCLFNKSECVKEGLLPCIPTGSCVYSQTEDSNGCDDGFLEYNLSYIWRPDPRCPGQMPSGKCESGPKSIECPAEIPIPFFDWVTWVISAIVIGVIYTGIYLFNKKKHSRS